MVFKKSSLTDLVTDGKSGIKTKLSKKILILIFSLLGIVVVLSAGGFFYMSSQSQKNASESGKLTEKQIKDLLAEVSEKMELPKGETPTIATVTDVTKLEDQPFFRKAINGDKVIIYGSTQKAILYRPSTHKIIDVAQINVNNNQGVNEPVNQSVAVTTITPVVSPSAVPSPTEEVKKLKVVVLNSTKESGLAKKAAALLDSDTAEVASTSNAVGEYEKTTVSSVAKDRKIADKDLKSLVSGFTKVSPTVIPLPSEEKAPTGVDVIIILGSDFSEAY